MTKFEIIRARAEENNGGPQGLEDRLAGITVKPRLKSRRWAMIAS